MVPRPKTKDIPENSVGSISMSSLRPLVSYDSGPILVSGDVRARRV